MMHHVSIRTADIFRAIAFYEQLGFIVSERFTAGITLACWMEGDLGRIELIQVPEPQPAPDPFGDECYTGYFDLSFDLPTMTPELPGWLDNLRQRFATAHPDQPLKVLLAPMQQVIGDRVWEVAFIADADGMPLEFIRLLGKINS